MKPTRIIIPGNGIASGVNKPRAISDEISARLMPAVGVMTTARASDIEPGQGLSQRALDALDAAYVVRDAADGPSTGPARIRPEFANHWFADMTPVAPGVVLGPWPPDSRHTALAAEVEWLHAHGIPTTDNPLPPASPPDADVETKTNDNNS